MKRLSFYLKLLLIFAISNALLIIPVNSVETNKSVLEIIAPSEISSKYLYGDNKDVEKANALVLIWLENKRNSEEYGDHHDTNYRRVVNIITASDGADHVDEFLEQELALTTSRRSRYAILQLMAERCEQKKDYKQAIELWQRAIDAVSTGTHPYYTTRQANPLLQIGRLYLQLGMKDDARREFEEYVTSEYGSRNAQGVFVFLGDLYEETGDWDKAKELYEHYWQFKYYKNDTILKTRLNAICGSEIETAQKLYALMQKCPESQRRKTRNQLYFIIADSNNRDVWARWLKRILAIENNPDIQKELEILLSLVTPLDEIGNHANQEDTKKLLEYNEQLRQRLRPYEVIMEQLFSRGNDNKYRDALQLALGGPHSISELSTDPEFEKYMESEYSRIRLRILQPEESTSLKKLSSRDGDGTRKILKENPTFRSFLKELSSLQSPLSGNAMLFLYALGHKEDIDFIIQNIPDDQYICNHALFGLAAALYRDQVVDIPCILECDTIHAKDWWNYNTENGMNRRLFENWWNQQKGVFNYSDKLSEGKRIYDSGPFSSITAVAAAPELDGMIFFVEGGFLDYSGAVYFFSFETEECDKLIQGGHDSGSGIYSTADKLWQQSGNRLGALSDLFWNSGEMCCEFNISPEKRVGLFFSKNGGSVERVEEVSISSVQEKYPKNALLGPGVQQYGNYTFEIRQGDLYLVNEKSGNAVCIEDFGYILSFAVNKNKTKALTIDRGILTQSLNLYDVENHIAEITGKNP